MSTLEVDFIDGNIFKGDDNHFSKIGVLYLEKYGVLC